MDIPLPECPCLHPGPKCAAWMEQWRQALVIPEEGGLFALEFLKFLGIVALILATALILLMAG